MFLLRYRVAARVTDGEKMISIDMGKSRRSSHSCYQWGSGHLSLKAVNEVGTTSELQTVSEGCQFFLEITLAY